MTSPDPTAEPEYVWAPEPAPEPRPVAGTALWLAIAAVGVSLFVGWGFPLAIGALIVAGFAIRRTGESRRVIAWTVGLAILSIVYSAGWLVWAVTRL